MTFSSACSFFVVGVQGGQALLPTQLSWPHLPSLPLTGFRSIPTSPCVFALGVARHRQGMLGGAAPFLQMETKIVPLGTARKKKKIRTPSSHPKSRVV